MVTDQMNNQTGDAPPHWITVPWSHDTVTSNKLAVRSTVRGPMTYPKTTKSTSTTSSQLNMTVKIVPSVPAPQTRTTAHHTFTSGFQRMCDFETNMCGWTEAKFDHFDWIRHNGSTPSPLTGPTADHTTGNNRGHYIYIEATNKAPGQHAILVSPSLSAGETYCLRLWYSMYGQYMGTLNIYTQKTGNTRVKAFTVSGDQGIHWHKARINLPSQSNAFRILIEGIRGTHYKSDIALDDISIDSGLCT